MRQYILILIFGLVLFSCHKNDSGSTPPTNEPLVDGLTDEQDSAIAASSVPNPALSEIKDFLDDPVGRHINRVEGGAITTPAAYLVGKLLSTANDLAERKKTVFHNEATPEHYGFAYSYGIRDLNARHFPTGGNSKHKSQAVFGTDCSGFIINLFELNGVNVKSSFVQDGTLLPAIQQAFSVSSEYSSLKLEEQPSGATVRAGDLIVWSNHIGIAFIKNEVQVYNSNGQPNPKDDAAQAKNLGVTRGIHAFSLSTMIQDPQTKNYWGPNYKIYRITDQNLITNGDFSLGNKDFITNYSFCDAANCLYPLANNGYSIANDASTRHKLFSGIDHTNGKGLFMIVNGGISSAVVWEQTLNVSKNTDYNFIGWYCTLNTTSIPTLAILINGIQIGSPFASPSTLNSWKNFRITWNSASNKTAKIQIFDTNNAASGNDFGIDDLYFGKK